MPETKIYIIRHGERGDTVSGGNFTEKNFDADGNYVPSNLNLQDSVPTRSDGIQAFAKDAPLSKVGVYTAGLLGRAYLEKGIKVDRVYSSPSLRVVQTAKGFLGGYGSHHAVVIEPGLFEWTGFVVYKNGHPSWMRDQEFESMGVNVDTSVDKIYDEDDLVGGESIEDYYTRSEKIIRTILDRHNGETILCFCHSTSHDACSRLIRGGAHRSKEQFAHILGHTQYLCNVEIVTHEDGSISCNRSPVPPMTVCQAKPFAHELLNMTDYELEGDMKKHGQATLWANFL